MEKQLVFLFDAQLVTWTAMRTRAVCSLVWSLSLPLMQCCLHSPVSAFRAIPGCVQCCHWFCGKSLSGGIGFCTRVGAINCFWYSSGNQVKIWVAFQEQCGHKALWGCTTGDSSDVFTMFHWFSELEVCFCRVKFGEWLLTPLFAFPLWMGLEVGVFVFAQLSVTLAPQREQAEQAGRWSCFPSQAVPRTEGRVYFGVIIQKLVLQLSLVPLPHTHTRFRD